MPIDYGTVTVLADFESGSPTAEWFTTHDDSTWGNGSITAVQTRSRNGLWSARMHLDTAVVTPSNSGERVELSSKTGNFEPRGGDNFWSFSTYYPSGTENGAGFDQQTFFNVYQWMDERANTSPPLSISLQKWPTGASGEPVHFVFNRLLIDQNTGIAIETFDHWDLGLLVLDQWDDWTVRIKQAMDSTGVVQVWRSTVLTADHSGVRTLDNAMPDGSAPRLYMEAQVYRNRGCVGTNTMYFDFLRRHTAYTVTGGGDVTPPVISNSIAVGTGPTTATVTWTTDEPADSQVDYGATTAYGSQTTLNTTLVTSHTVNITGLTASTTYHTRARSKDAVGNGPTLGPDLTFTTTAALDTYGTVVLADSPIGFWRQSEASGTVVVDGSGNGHLGTYSGSGVTLGQPGIVATNNAVRYAGGSASVPFDLSTFSTLSLEFWLKWDAFANDDQLAAEFTPNYGGAVDGGFVVNPNSSSNPAGLFEVAMHTVATGFLSAGFPRPNAGTWHHYVVIMDRTLVNASDQLRVYVDSVLQTPTLTGAAVTQNSKFANSALNLMSRNGASLFGHGVLDEVALYSGTLSATRIAAHYTAATGDITPPVISADSFVGASATSVTATWTTNEASDSQIEYGLDTSYGNQTTLDTTMVTVHSVTATGLQSNVLYHGRVRSKDASGNLSVGPDRTFTLKAVDTIPPVITGVDAAPTTGSAVFTWLTDELSDTQVEYGTTATYGTLSTRDATLVLTHTTTVVGLTDGTLYHFRARSRDAAGNLGTSQDFTFTTLPALPPGTPPPVTPGGIVTSVDNTLRTDLLPTMDERGVHASQHNQVNNDMQLLQQDYLTYAVRVTAKPAVTGSRGGNAALTSLLSALAGLGVITDNTTP